MSKKTSITLIAIATLILGCAGAAFAQGNGTGKGQEKKKTIASVFKWHKSWKSDSKPNGNAKFNRYKGLSKKTGHSPESLWAWYESERAKNPRLTHGQFVAANMIAQNPKKGISAQTILTGMRNGDSIGQVLHRRGMTEKEIRSERDRVRKLVLDDRGFDYEYDDLDNYWRIRR